MTAVVLTFADNFWGERNNGFDVLNANLKYGQDSLREMLEFLKESNGMEEATVRQLQKLSKSCGLYGSKGSFGPMWQQVKVLLERLASVHYQLVNGWSDLNKDIQRYADEQAKKQRVIRENEAATSELVQNIQQTAMAVQKSKEYYHARCMECERMKKEGVSQKEYEKVESKCRRAADDYRAQVDKYNGIRVQFEARMTESCKRFQEAEEVHLKQMKDFVKIYASAWRLQRHLLEQVCDEFDSSVNELSVQKLIDKFVETKMTGKEKPGLMVFEEYDGTSVAIRATPDIEKSAMRSEKYADGTSNMVATPTEGTVAAATNKQSMLDKALPNRANMSWFRRRPGRKDKNSKTSKENKDNDDMENGDDGKGKRGPTVDSEGFSLPPPPSKEDIGAGGTYKVAYSDSDSGSDDEGGSALSRIKVQIKPFNLLDMPIETDTTSDLKKSVGALRLSPTAIKRQTPTSDMVKMKKSISISDSLSSDNSSQSAAAKADSTTKELSGSLFEADYKPMINWGATSSVPATKTSTPWGPVDNPVSETKTEVKVGEGWASWDNPAPAAPAANSQQSWAVFDAPVAGRTDSGKSTPTAALGTAGSPALPPKTRSRSPGLPAVSQFQSKNADVWGTAPVSTAKSVDTWGNATVTRTGDTWGAVVTGVSVSSSVVTPRSTTPQLSATGAKLLSSSSATDTIPIAVAFLETIHAQLGSPAGEMCQLIGDMKISFPADLIRWLSSDAYVPPPLVFHLNNALRCDKIVINTDLLTETGDNSAAGSRSYSFKMPSVAAHLKKLAEQNNRAPFYNVDVLRYQIYSGPGGPKVPLSMRSLWKPSPSQLAYRMDCQFHPSFFGRTSGLLKNVKVIVQVSGGAQQVQAVPSAEWSEEGSQAVWRLEGVDGGRMVEGAVRAQFVVSDGASAPAATAVQFACDDVSLSRVQFELATSGYKLSLLRNRVTTGKYVCEPEICADL